MFDDFNDYVVTITEVLVREVPMSAYTKETAKNAVIDEYNNEEIVLDYNDLQEVKFSVKKVEKSIDNN